MNLTINGRGAGRVVFNMFDDVTPKTCRNFRELATGQNGFGYAGSGTYPMNGIAIVLIVALMHIPPEYLRLSSNYTKLLSLCIVRDSRQTFN